MKVLEEIVKKIIDKCNKGTVLYESITGSNTVLTLSDDASNYEYLEIEYVQGGSTINRIKAKNNERATLFYTISGTIDNKQYVQVGSNLVEIKSKTITFLNGNYVNFYSDAFRNASFVNSSIYIKKVVGYK